MLSLELDDTRVFAEPLKYSGFGAKSAQSSFEVRVFQDCRLIDEADIVATAGSNDMLHSVGEIGYDIDIFVHCLDCKKKIL